MTDRLFGPDWIQRESGESIRGISIETVVDVDRASDVEFAAELSNRRPSR